MSVLRNIFKKLRIRETIKYYIVNWYSNTWFFNNVIYKMYLLENHLSKCLTKEEAIRVSTLRTFRWIPKSSKRKLIEERFKQ